MTGVMTGVLKARRHGTASVLKGPACQPEALHSDAISPWARLVDSSAHSALQAEGDIWSAH